MSARVFQSQRPWPTRRSSRGALAGADEGALDPTGAPGAARSDALLDGATCASSLGRRHPMIAAITPTSAKARRAVSTNAAILAFMLGFSGLPMPRSTCDPPTQGVRSRTNRKILAPLFEPIAHAAATTPCMKAVPAALEGIEPSFKKCGCGKSYSRASWEHLPRIG